MKFESDKKPEFYAVSGTELRVHLDVTEATRQDFDGTTRTVFQGEEVVTLATATKSQIVEAIIASKYSVTEEIALNRKPDDDPTKVAYLAFVSKAKSLAAYVHPLVLSESKGIQVTQDEKDQLYEDALNVQAAKDRAAQTITARQARQALIELDKEASVELTLNNIPNAKQQKTVRNWYENSQVWIYGNPILTQFAAVLGIDKDEFFALAKTL